MAKGLRKPIARSTNTQADAKLERVPVDLSGKMAVPSSGGKRYTLIVRDDHTRLTRVYFLAKKSALAGRGQRVRIVSSRGSNRRYTIGRCVCSITQRGRIFQRRVRILCRKRGIKQEFTPSDSPKHDGVAERALALISDTAITARTKLKYCTQVHRPTRHCGPKQCLGHATP